MSSLERQSLIYSDKHDSNNIIMLFNHCFKGTHNTLLIAGEGEPIYLPAEEKYQYHRIEFAHGYFASALHEIAHWCIAGDDRRLKIDYDYWYIPDGRNKKQQAAFEQVEVKPQALEWAFSLASNFKFSISADNLSSVPEDTDWKYWTDLEHQQKQFTLNIKEQLVTWIESGFPERAQLMIDSLCQHYRKTSPISTNDVESSPLWINQCQVA